MYSSERKVVLRRRLNVGSDGDDVKESGRLLHVHVAAVLVCVSHYQSIHDRHMYCTYLMTLM